jgi:hypothetical protein
MTGDVIASYRVLKGTIQTYRPELLEALAGKFRTRPPSLQTVDAETGFGVIVDTVELELDDAYTSFITSDRSHRVNEARLEVSRKDRDEAREDVSTTVKPVSNVAEYLFGASASHLLGFAAQTPDSFDLFLEQGTTLAALLRDPGGEVEASLIGYNVDLPSLADEIGTKTAFLKKLGDDAELQRRATEASMLKRRDALARYDLLADGAADILKALFKLAGLPEHAQRVERTIPRRSSSQADTGEEGVEGPTEGEVPEVGPSSEVASTVEAEESPTRLVTPGPWPRAVPAVEEAEPGSDPLVS